MKKPAQLSDNLLSMRPRKGEAKPQTEDQAAQQKSAPKPAANPAQTPSPRRRRRLSDKKMQLNLRVSEKSLERFTKFADDDGLLFGDLFERMLETYANKK